MDKFKIRKLCGSLSGLTLVSLTLVVSMLALFIANRGFGWATVGDHADAYGMLAGVTAPESPVEEFQFYTVFDTDGFTDRDGVNYAFAPLGIEVAHMNMGNYSKLEAPTYHILLRVVFKDGVKNVRMKTYIEGSTLTLTASDLPTMVRDKTPVGMSAALEFYMLLPDEEHPTIVTPENGYSKEKLDDNGVGVEDANGNVVMESANVLWLDDAVLEGKEGDTFPLQEDQSGETTVLTYSGMDDATVNLAEGQHELYVFITYSAERINLLQDYAYSEALKFNEGKPAGEQISLDEQNFKFKSDFFIFFEDLDKETGS